VHTRLASGHTFFSFSFFLFRFAFIYLWEMTADCCFFLDLCLWLLRFVSVCSGSVEIPPFLLAWSGFSSIIVGLGGEGLGIVLECAFFRR
jgi:hypothetical protein